MKIMGGLLAVVLLLAGCSSSGGGMSAAEQSAHYRAQAREAERACQAFDRFETDLIRLTPRRGWNVLMADTQAVAAPLIHANRLDARGSALYDDVMDLVAHVGSSSWTTSGTPLDRQVTTVEDDCAAYG